MLADVTADSDGEIELGITRYLYLHCDGVFKVLGIPISKAIFDETDLHFEELYKGAMICCFLYLLIYKIINFFELFKDEFKNISCRHKSLIRDDTTNLV